MKIVFVIIMVLFALVSGRQNSYANARQVCFEGCDSDYDKCVAPVINLPEPRTPEEQGVLDQCRQEHDTCQHGCEELSNQDEAPKQENNN